MERGSVELFMGMRLAVAVATMCLIGAALSWASSLSGFAEERGLNSAADVIEEAVLDIQAAPPSTIIRRTLPPLRGVTVEVGGETGGLISIRISGKEVLERYVLSSIPLDGGARAEDPKLIEVTREEKIAVRLIT